VTRKQVLDFSPTLADKVAVRTENLTAQGIAIQILRKIRPDLYEKHPRSELERLASGEAAKLLQQELERARDELWEYTCPFCGAPLVDGGGQFVGPNSDHHGLHKIFECGYHAFDGYTEQPCPSDPKFPRFEDYELEFHHTPSAKDHSWLCLAIPKTEMARRLSLQPGYGRTKEEAGRHLRERYDHYATKHSE
jgi:hypothetical protein